jgi:hypothetical protein
MQLWDFRVTLVIQWSLMLAPILYTLAFPFLSAATVVILGSLLDLLEQLLSEIGYEIQPVCRLHDNKCQITVMKKIIKLCCGEL